MGTSKASSTVMRRAALILLVALLVVSGAGLVGYEQGVHNGLAILEIEESVDPSEIFVKGSDVRPETSTVTLRLEAPERTERLSEADVMIVVDRSASFEIEQATSAAKRIVGRLGPNDRVGLVSFATDATLDVPLTFASRATRAFEEALDELKPEGKTGLGDGIAVAASELAFSGRSHAALVAVLLTDGRTNFGRDPLEAAQEAADDGVTLHAVGIGRFVNSSLLNDITRTTGGRFFSTFTEGLVDEITGIPVTAGEALASDIEITETLSEEINYERALRNGPVRAEEEPDGTTTLTWRPDDLRAGETWIARYIVSSDEVGTFRLHEHPSVVHYSDFRDREVEEDLPEVHLRIREEPKRPNAAFGFEPKDPTRFDEIEFTDESTVEEDGRIVRWHWRFGDGDTSSEQNPTHAYDFDGTYRVTLTVTTDEGIEDSVSRSITVSTPRVGVRRDIDTFIPINQTLADRSFRVTVKISLDDDMEGLGLDENVPEEWEVKPINNAGAQLREDELQWLFFEKLEPGDTREIVYEVTVPKFTDPGTYRIDGSVSSASPTLSLPVEGDNEVEIVSGLPVRIVVAHWDTSDQTLDFEEFPEHRINKNQLLQAIAWWKEGEEVPFTEDEDDEKQLIDFETMQKLVAYWLTNVSVFEELPNPDSEHGDHEDGGNES